VTPRPLSGRSEWHHATLKAKDKRRSRPAEKPPDPMPCPRCTLTVKCYTCRPKEEPTDDSA